MPARPIPPPAPGKRALAPRSSLKIFYLPAGGAAKLCSAGLKSLQPLPAQPPMSPPSTHTRCGKWPARPSYSYPGTNYW